MRSWTYRFSFPDIISKGIGIDVTQKMIEVAALAKNINETYYF
ncbi:hypothetical protein ACEQPO_01860 [Bacillus sp. SL00103]